MPRMEDLAPLWEEAFSKGLTFTFPIHGTSMRPLLKTGDLVTIERYSRVVKGDIVLYKRDNGVYVLHRVRRVHKNSYTMVGDHQRATEKGLREDQLIARVVSYRRQEEEKERTLKNLRYRLYKLLVRSDILRYFFGRMYK